MPITAPPPDWNTVKNKPSTVAGFGITDAVTQGNVSQYVPPGVVHFFAHGSIGAGYIKANGAWLSRTAYAALFAVIGTMYGAADGVNYFALPDLRGAFPRFWDDGRGVDSGRGFATWQGDAIRNIVGSATVFTRYINTDNAADGAFYVTDGGGQGESYNYANTRPKFVFDASRVVPTAGENRPVNMPLIPCIKY